MLYVLGRQIVCEPISLGHCPSLILTKCSSDPALVKRVDPIEPLDILFDAPLDNHLDRLESMVIQLASIRSHLVLIGITPNFDKPFTYPCRTLDLFVGGLSLRGNGSVWKCDYS